MILACDDREFFEFKGFGHPLDIDDLVTVKAMNTNAVQYVSVDEFKKVLLTLTIEERQPQLPEPARMLSNCQPFPWSRPVWEGNKTVFNLAPCDNSFERDFAKLLDGCPDIKAFVKLPQVFGFSIEYTDAAMNLRSYFPDFVALDGAGKHWLLETKGQETIDVLRKDAAALRWCENATSLTEMQWRYVEVQQKEYEALRPHRFADLAVLQVSSLW